MKGKRTKMLQASQICTSITHNTCALGRGAIASGLAGRGFVVIIILYKRGCLHLAVGVALLLSVHRLLVVSRVPVIN